MKNDNFNEIILNESSKKLIDIYTYNDLIRRDKITFWKKLTEEEIEYLKFINSNSLIEFKLNDYEHIMLINNKLKEFGKKNKIKIIVDNKKNFNKFIFENNIEETNIFLKTSDTEEISLVEYLKYEKVLYQMISNTEKLSPFEKYIYAYNITKQFKKYKENPNDDNVSRNLYSLLDSEYMVCAGYSNLFGDLLDKIGIGNTYLSVDVDKSYDEFDDSEAYVNDSIPVKRNGHARRYVHIVDSKYNIDGYYISDPTWDNDLTHDYYSHLAITDEEITHSFRYNWLDYTDIFNVVDMNDYVNKIKYIRNHNKKDKFIGKIFDILNIIKDIDIKEYNNLITKYEYIKGRYGWPVEFMDLIYDLGEIILKKVNKTISGDTIFNAIEEVYKSIYYITDEDLFILLEKVRKENIERYNITFPTRYKIDQSNNTEEIENENKFETRRL